MPELSDPNEDPMKTILTHEGMGNGRELKRANSKSKSSNRSPDQDVSLPSAEVLSKINFKRKSILPGYSGDMFSNRGGTLDGLLYMSRIENNRSQKFNQALAEAKKISEAKQQGRVSTPAHDLKALGATERRNFHRQKLKCAVSFERMIQVRLAHTDNVEPTVSKLIQEGIIESILTLLSLSHVDIQGHCVRALRLLSNFPSARVAVIQRGVLKAILNLVIRREALDHAMEHDVILMCVYLTEEDSLETRLVAENMDKIVTKLNQSTSPQVQKLCYLTYFNLSCPGAKQVDVANDPSSSIKIMSIIPSILAEVKHSLLPEGTLILVKTLLNLALNPVHHTVLLEEGIVQTLEPILAQNVHDTLNLKLIQIVMRIYLDLVSENRRDRTQCFMTGPTLTALHKFCCSTTDPKLLECCSHLYLKLASEAKNRPSLIKYGAIEALCSLIQTPPLLSPNEKPASGADFFSVSSKAIRLICSGDNILQPSTHISEKAHASLFSICHHSNEEVQLNALSAISSLAATSSLASSPVPQADPKFIIVKILNFLDTHVDDASVQLQCLSILYNFSCEESNLEAITSHPALIPILISRLSAHSSKHRDPMTVLLLHQLSKIPAVQDRLLPHLPRFIQLLTDPELYLHAGHTVYHLSSHAHFPQGIALLRHIETVCHIIDTPYVNVSSILISKWSQVESNRHVMLSEKHHVMPYLHRVAHEFMDQQPVSHALALTLFELSSNLASTAFHAEFISLVIHLSRAPSDVMKELTMLSLVRLSNRENHEVTMVTCGGVKAILIIALVGTDNTTIKTECAKALCNCLVNPACVPEMVKDGVLWGLSSLCQNPDPAIQHACATAFCNLSSVPHTRVEMLTAGVPRAILHLANATIHKSFHHHSEEVDSKTIQACLYAISNFISDPPLCAMLAKEGLVVLLDELVTRKDFDLARHVMLKLINVDERCRKLYMREGLISTVGRICSEPGVPNALLRNALVTLQMLTSNACRPSTDLFGSSQTYTLQAPLILSIISKITSTSASATLENQVLCCRILYNMTCCSAILAHLCQNCIMTDEITACLDIAKDERSTLFHEIQDLVTTALHNLSCTTEHHTRLVSAGCITILQHLYHQPNKTFGIKHTIFHAIVNLTLGQVNTTRVLSDGGAKLIITHLPHVTEIDDFLLASAALRKLCGPLGNQCVIIKDGVLRAFMKLLHDDALGKEQHEHQAFVFNCVAALRKLSESECNGGEMVKANIIQRIIALSDAYPDHEAITHECFTILSNLAVVDAESYEIELDETFIMKLMQLSDSIQPDEDLEEQEQQCPYWTRGIGKALPGAEILSQLLLPHSQFPSIQIGAPDLSYFKLPAGECKIFVDLPPIDQSLVDIPDMEAHVSEPPKIVHEYFPKQIVSKPSISTKVPIERNATYRASRFRLDPIEK